MNENQKFDLLSKKFFNITIERNPVKATYLGLHQYDHLMPDELRKRYLEDIKIMKEFLRDFKDINSQKLTPARKLDRELAIHNLKLSLFYLEKIRQWESNPDEVSYVGDAIFPLFVRDFAPLEARIKNIISRLQKVPEILNQTKKRIRKPVKVWAEIAIESCERIPHFFDEILKTSKQQKLNKKILSQLKMTIDDAENAIKSYGNYLKKVLPRSKKEFAIGDKKFRKLLELRKLGMTPEEILVLGEKYLKDSKILLKKIAKKIKPGASIEEVKKDIEKKRPKGFEKVLEAYRKSVRKSKKFVIEKDFATLPSNEELKVIETPNYMRHFTPFAAYFQPAKFDKKQLGIYIVTPSEKRNVGRYNYPNINNTSVHEGYPGHHLQLACANKNPSLIRILTHATEFIEGWAHYCEEYMKELGYSDTLEERFIQTRDMIWRAARIIIDVKLSTGKMNFDEAVNFLMKQTGMSKEGAIAEVKRYTYSPGYQLSYLLGKHLLIQLKEEMKRRLGKKFSDKSFHDTLLYGGSLPIYFMRKNLEEKFKIAK